ncbi:hypothetical protein [Corynebacterium halotolerans]|uniref:hypothetical protein n=1 Tax=Corynebacterium halotolerans TaxID=225326 RepID=UPI003CEE89E0
MSSPAAQPTGLDDTLTVFLGRGRLSQGIRQTLEDFTATGLIRDLVWVDADSFRSSSAPVTHLRVSADGHPEITREPFNVLIARSGADQLNLGVLNIVGGPDSQIGHAELATLTEAVDAVGSFRNTHRTNLIITAVGAPLDGDLPVLSGYVNLMLAPEDSPGPESATVPYHFDQVDNRFTLHCVAGIASLFGIWEGSTSAPVAGLSSTSGSSFRLVRAFYRRVDGQGVQARLKERILDTTRNPLPRLDRPGQNVTADYTEHPGSFAADAAEELLGEFNARLLGETATAYSEKTERTTSRSALGEFFGTWAKNMVGTPKRFWRSLRAGSGDFVDDTVQSALYGETGSRTRVGGVADRDDSGAADSPFGRAGRHSYAEQAAAELQQVWSSYANTAMSLLDAYPRMVGEQTSETRLPGVVSSASPGRVQVARSAEDVIPGPGTNFGAELPVEVKALAGGAEVAPYDLRGAVDYEQRLSRQAQDQQRDIGRVLGDFKQWREHHSGSFAHHVARGLHHRLEEQRQRDSSLSDEITRLRAREPRAGASTVWAGVFRWLGWVAFWSLAVFLVLWSVFHLRGGDSPAGPDRWIQHLNDAPGETRAWFFGTWFGIWLAMWVLQVVFETVQQIRLRHRRRTIVDRLSAAEENQRQARRAITRLEVGYQQFLSVSQIIGTLLERPFGTVSQERVDATIPTNTMPDSVVFAEANPDDVVVDELAQRFRRDLYRAGWLDTYVFGAVNEAAAEYSARTGSTTDPNQVFGTGGSGTGGALARFADYVSSPDFRSRDRSRGEWAEITRHLGGYARRDDAGVLSPLMTYRGGERFSAPHRLPLAHSVAVGSFNGEIATELGRVDGVLELAPEFCSHARHPNTFDAIGVSEVLVQVGESATQKDVAFRGAQRAPLSAETISNMPVTEDAQPQSDWVQPAPQPKHQLPGMGEF